MRYCHCREVSYDFCSGGTSLCWASSPYSTIMSRVDDRSIIYGNDRQIKENRVVLTDCGVVVVLI